MSNLIIFPLINSNIFITNVPLANYMRSDAYHDLLIDKLSEIKYKFLCQGPTG